MVPGMRVRQTVLLRVLFALSVSATIARPATFELAADSLRVRLQEDPWRLEFVDAAGRSVLTEATDRSPGPAGPLGFRTAAGWVHATRAVSTTNTRDTLGAEVETTDPLGRRLEVLLARDAEGVIALSARLAAGPRDDVEALGIGFEADSVERFLRFGRGPKPRGHGAKPGG